MTAERSSISASELEVLKTLWENGPGKAREVLEVLRARGFRWAYTTVLTLLQRLEAKGYVTSDRSTMAYQYHPAVSRDGLLRDRLRDLSDQLCEGAIAPVLLALVRGHRPSADEVAEVRRWLDELEGEGKRERGSRTRRRGRKAT